MCPLGGKCLCQKASRNTVLDHLHRNEEVKVSVQVVDPPGTSRHVAKGAVLVPGHIPYRLFLVPPRSAIAKGVPTPSRFCYAR